MAQYSRTPSDSAEDRTTLCCRIRRQYGDRAEIMSEDKRGAIYLRWNGQNCPGLMATVGQNGWHVVSVNAVENGVLYMRLMKDGYMKDTVSHATNDSEELHPNYGTFNR